MLFTEARIFFKYSFLYKYSLKSCKVLIKKRLSFQTFYLFNLEATYKLQMNSFKFYISLYIRLFYLVSYKYSL